MSSHVYENVAKKYSNYLFTQIDANNQKDLVRDLGIEQFPTLMLYKDGVLLFNPAKIKGRSSKLTCKWEGPYTITRKLSDLIYEIKLSSTSKPRIVHVNRLKPYVGKMRKWFVPPSDRKTRGQGTQNTQID